MVETPTGYDIAPVAAEGRATAVLFCRLEIAAGTTPDAVTEALHQRVQHARHVSVRDRGGDRVPCHVRFEPDAGFVCAPRGAAMELPVKVKTWAAAESALRPRQGGEPEWLQAKNGGALRVTRVWASLAAYRAEYPATPPLTEYTLLVRGSESSLGGVLEQCRRVRDGGFVNYASALRFGVPLAHSVRFARAYLECRFTECVLLHIGCLARASRECCAIVGKLRERLEGCEGSARNARFEWQSAAASLEAALEREKHTCRVAHARSADMDLEPVHAALALAQHVASAGGDCAAVLLHSVVPTAVLQWHMRALGDTHFNVLASVRVRRHGARRVAVGDVVCRDPQALQALDPIAAPAFVMPSAQSLTYDRRLRAALDAADVREALSVVKTEADAAACDMSMVVLPRWGVDCGRDVPFPELPGLDRASYDRVAASLRLPAVPPPRIHIPFFAFRPVVVRPRWLHAHCWDARVSSEFALDDDAGLVEATQCDSEGWRRLVPFAGGATVAGGSSEGEGTAAASRLRRIRPAVQHAGPRASLLSMVEMGAITTALRVALPAGAALTSALREIFRVKHVDSRDVAVRVEASVQHGWEQQRGQLESAERRKRKDAERRSRDF